MLAEWGNCMCFWCMLLMPTTLPGEDFSPREKWLTRLQLSMGEAKWGLHPTSYQCPGPSVPVSPQSAILHQCIIHVLVCQSVPALISF